jgi:hypothetical protein
MIYCASDSPIILLAVPYNEPQQEINGRHITKPLYLEDHPSALFDV